MRFIVRRDGEGVRAFTRRDHDWTDRAPRIVEAMRSLWVRSITIDGQAVVCAPTGVTDFDRLRSALVRGSPEAFLYAFDLPELNGTGRALLAVGGPSKSPGQARPGIRISEHIESGYGQAMFEAACTMGLEGIVSTASAPSD